jgi:hypothetical protein
VSKGSGLTEIVKFWRDCPLDRPPFVHPEDLATLGQYEPSLLKLPRQTFQQFVAGSRFGDFDDPRFHLSLLPTPYAGDLERADIFLLQLNPGLNFTDYYGEWKVPKFRRRLIRNLRQELDGLEFPFAFLDPEFCWHSGFRWWEEKLRGVATTIANRKQVRYLDALRELSRRIAAIELVPYHSISFRDHRLIKDLASARQAKQYAQDLRSKALLTKCSIIITRKVKEWGLRRMRNGRVVLYSPALARGASLGPKTKGGQAILRMFGI